MKLEFFWEAVTILEILEVRLNLGQATQLDVVDSAVVSLLSVDIAMAGAAKAKKYEFTSNFGG